jgi:phosphoribosylaminoimidazole-succinocarboxamide synthase
MQPLTQLNLKIQPLKQGKVRALYDLGDKLLLVATDRLSAFDHVFAAGIPYKGQVLTGISRYWFERTAARIKNHFLSTELKDFPPEFQQKELAGRAMLVRKTKVVPIECIVRGYLEGSGWKDYQKTGTICGYKLPENLRQGDKLPEPLFTPSTKADAGHDENISAAKMHDLIGRDLGEQLKQKSLELYTLAAQDALAKGLIIADTKFEFGQDAQGKLILIDEVLTPDSSRFWDVKLYQPGKSQQSFDKQFVRDYLESLNWNKEPPAPPLPPDIVQKTSEKYREAYERITGQKLL